MKKLLLTVFIFISLFAKADYWTRKATFIGIPEIECVSGFSIGSNGYIGTQNFWEYNSLMNTWSQKADYANGKNIFGSIGFSIGNKGYMATGGYFYLENEFWEYDPTINIWIRKADYGGGKRAGAMGFSIATKGYIGLGGDSFTEKKDFWEYDPSLDKWIQKADFPGTIRSSAVAFNIGLKGYIGLGEGSGNKYFKDFWEYNPITNSWLQKADFPGTPRFLAVGFSIGLKGYVGTGADSLSTVDFFNNDLWEYNPINNAWSRKSDLTGGARYGATSLTIGNKGYVGLGSKGFSQYYDFWEYTPDSTVNINQISFSFDFTLSQNPTHHSLHITHPSNKKLEFTIIDINGKKMLGDCFGRSSIAMTGSVSVDVSSLAAGVYFLEATDGRERVVKKFLKE